MKGQIKSKKVNYAVVRIFILNSQWVVEPIASANTLSVVGLHSTWTTKEEAEKVARQLNKEEDIARVEKH